jgi:general stress protein 26
MADQTNDEKRKKLAELIRKVKFTMLTTTEADGSLRSRPMTMLDEDFAGEVWFFVGSNSGTVAEIKAESQVNLSFADPGANIYVSLSGTASLVRDRKKAEELWNPIYKAWFPDGLDDPNLALLRVQATEAEYWDSPDSRVVQAVGFVKSLVTGQQANPGENEKVALGGA